MTVRVTVAEVEVEGLLAALDLRPDDLHGFLGDGHQVDPLAADLDLLEDEAGDVPTGR